MGYICGVLVVFTAIFGAKAADQAFNGHNPYVLVFLSILCGLYGIMTAIAAAQKEVVETLKSPMEGS